MPTSRSVHMTRVVEQGPRPGDSLTQHLSSPQTRQHHQAVSMCCGVFEARQHGVTDSTSSCRTAGQRVDTYRTTKGRHVVCFPADLADDSLQIKALRWCQETGHQDDDLHLGTCGGPPAPILCVPSLVLISWPHTIPIRPCRLSRGKSGVGLPPWKVSLPRETQPGSSIQGRMTPSRGCQALLALERCRGCGLAHYCGQECQDRDKEAHGPNCPAMAMEGFRL